MSKIIDLTGKRFGRLTVVSETLVSPNGYNVALRWKCVCDCGKTTITRGDSLKGGVTKSCGCYHRGVMAKRKRNRIGQRYGVLTVLSEDQNRSKSGQIQWRCICDCGRLRIVVGAYLKKISASPCQCKPRRALALRPSLCGQRFGYLSVLSENPERTKRGNVQWDCVCDCGNRVVAHTSHLRGGSIKSCGCYKTALNMTKHSILTPADLPIELVKTKIAERRVVKFLESFN